MRVCTHRTIRTHVVQQDVHYLMDIYLSVCRTMNSINGR